MEDMYQYLKSYLSEEFIASLKVEMDKPYPNKGLVINLRRCPLSTIRAEFNSFTPLKDNFGLYDMSKDYPGHNPLEDGGAYYILDPSSYRSVSSLKGEGSELVLDMCAAPGGKTIAYALNNPDSVIVANDISPSRAKELSRNVERLGLNNVIVTSLDPEAFIKYRLSNCFTTVILDAPCSGTGMFRKEEKMKEDWTYQKALRLLPIQDNLLKVAYQLLAPNGKMMYSTCSFLKEEDEDRIEAFISQQKDMHLYKAEDEEGLFKGTIDSTYHIFPNLYKGEGHFFALMEKDGNDKPIYSLNKKAKFDKDLNLYTITLNGEDYGINKPYSLLFSLPFYRFGIKITDHSQYAKIKYDHALSHYLVTSQTLDLSYAEAEKYLRGEEMRKVLPFKNGPIIISYKKVNLGYSLYKDGRIRNMLPKGLRINSL